jgi:broad specificity phosphatase PhoE
VSESKKQAIFIRHGQSRANVGIWDGEFSQIPLTEIGEEQARVLAESWNFTPSHIIVSPYLRTQQTAAPTIARFPHVPVETWDIHEFTYWDRAHWGDTTPEDSLEDVAHFWRVADPHHRRGNSESFGELLQRTETALKKLETLAADGKVLLFSHGHFMQAMRHSLLHPEWDASQKMLTFREYDDAYKVRNTELMGVDLKDGKWRLR